MFRNLFVSSVFLLISFALGAVNTDSLLQVASADVEDSIKASAYHDLAHHYFYIDTDSSRKYFNQFINSTDDRVEKASAYKRIGICYAYDGGFDTAVYYVEKALEVFVEVQDSLNIAYSYNSMGLLRINQGKYEEGVELLFESIKWKEYLLGRYPVKKLSFGSTYLNIGIGFHSMEQYNKALEYYQIAKKNYEKEQSESEANRADAQIANAFIDLKEYEKAEQIYEQIIGSKVFENNPYLLVKVYNNYGMALLELGKYNRSEKIILKALELNTKFKNDFSINKNLNNLAELYIKTQCYHEAIEYGMKGYELAQKTKNIRSETVASLNLSEAYELTNNYRKAYEFLTIHRVLCDSTYVIEQNNTIAELEAKYQSEKKLQQIQELEHENEINELTIKKQRAISWLAVTVVTIVVIALIIIVSALRKVRRQEKLLAFSNRELKVLNDSLQKMFAIISHDLRNLISGFKNAGDLVAYYLEKEKPQKLKKLASELSSNSIWLEELLNNLLNWAISQGSLYQPVPTSFSIKTEIDKLIQLSEAITNEKQIEVENNINSTTAVYSDLNSFNFMIRNILSNSVKFTTEGKIWIDAISDEKYTVITISDTGTGIPKQKLGSLFQLGEEKKSVGTAGEKGSGLGLKLVKDFVELNNGKVSIDSEVGQGTNVTISLPVKPNMEA